MADSFRTHTYLAGNFSGRVKNPVALRMPDQEDCSYYVRDDKISTVDPSEIPDMRARFHIFRD